MTDLEIRYDNGRMLIHLEGFFSCHNITKVRKLLKIIQRSYTQEAADQIQQYLKEQIGAEDEFTASLKAVANKGVSARSKAKELEEPLNKAICIRDRYKKKSEPYEHWNEEVKKYREEIKEQNGIYRSSVQTFKTMKKEREFLQKSLEVFS